MNVIRGVLCFHMRNNLKFIFYNNVCTTTIKFENDRIPPTNDSNSNIENAKNKSKQNCEEEQFFKKHVNKEKSVKAKEKLENLLKEFKYVYSSKDQNIKVPRIGKKKIDIRPKDFESNLHQSINTVARSLGGDSKQTEKELFDSLKKLKTVAGSKPFISEKPHFEEVIRNDSERIHFDTRSLEDKLGFKFMSGLNIIKNKNKGKQVDLKLWNTLQEEHLKYLALKLPKNYFEELILWTNQGRLWHFPIDNEQGIDEEAKVDFTEHVFLEEHLEPWCPQKGPIRNFMELVIIGLQKNPYLKVEDKKEHINWYKNYFEKKRNLLIKLGAVPETEKIV